MVARAKHFGRGHTRQLLAGTVPDRHARMGIEHEDRYRQAFHQLTDEGDVLEQGCRVCRAAACVDHEQSSASGSASVCGNRVAAVRNRFCYSHQHTLLIFSKEVSALCLTYTVVRSHAAHHTPLITR